MIIISLANEVVFMKQTSQWLVRTIFVVYMIYIYFFVYRVNSFYSFLLLNTFLAYIPIELAMHMHSKQNRWVFWLFFLVWALFYPNAPYLLTDLYHLARVNPYDPQTNLMMFHFDLWKNFADLVLAALGCTLMGMWSLDYVAHLVAIRLHQPSRLFCYSLVAIFNFFSAIGVFIGRFLRLHSIYLIFEPQWALQKIAQMWDLKALIFIVSFFIIQMAVWICMEIYRHSLQQFN